MAKRVWLIRLLVVLAFTAITALFALIPKETYAASYMNTSFIIGLIFLMVAAVAYTIIFGFWNVFAAGSKLMFRRRDEDEDDTHWSFDKPEVEETVEHLREGAKRELFIFIPLTVGLVLLAQAITILYLI